MVLHIDAKLDSYYTKNALSRAGFELAFWGLVVASLIQFIQVLEIFLQGQINMNFVFGLILLQNEEKS